MSVSWVRLVVVELTLASLGFGPLPLPEETTLPVFIYTPRSTSTDPFTDAISQMRRPSATDILCPLIPDW